MTPEHIVGLLLGVFWALGTVAWWESGKRIAEAMAIHAHNKRMVEGFREALELNNYGAHDEAVDLIAKLSKESMS
jgi:hypothetical protein